MYSGNGSSMLASKTMLERTKFLEQSDGLKAYNKGVKKRCQGLEEAIEYCHKNGISYGEYQRREFFNELKSKN